MRPFANKKYFTIIHLKAKIMKIYDLMMKRRSVRNFKDQKIPDHLVKNLLDAANNAPSGGNLQPISIIVIREAKTKKELAELLMENQPWVKNAPLSLIFCIDFYRLKKWASMSNTDFLGNNSLATFLTSYADAMISAQNVVILAENYGLGSVYIGTVQLRFTKIRKLLSIPEFVLPIISLSIGYPQSIPESVPKLNRDVIIHHEKYKEMSDADILKAYENKYGDWDDNLDIFLEKNYIEAIEYDKQLDLNLVNETKERIKRFKIQNPAQFLFNLRYPYKASVALNKKLFRELKNAGFEFLY